MNLSWLTAKIGNYLLAALLAGALLGWGVTAMTMQTTINSLDKSINNPKTGYIARLSQATADLSTCRGNNAVLDSALKTQNAAVIYYQKRSDYVAQQAVARIVEIQGNVREVNRDVERIKKVPRTGNECADAKAVIKEALK